MGAYSNYANVQSVGEERDGERHSRETIRTFGTTRLHLFTADAPEEQQGTNGIGGSQVLGRMTYLVGVGCDPEHHQRSTVRGSGSTRKKRLAQHITRLTFGTTADSDTDVKTTNHYGSVSMPSNSVT